jgi:hypothetical protein
MADIQNIVETIGGLSLLEASELVKALEDKFGVSAAAAAMAPAAVGAGAAAAPVVEEKDTFDVIQARQGRRLQGRFRKNEETTHRRRRVGRIEVTLDDKRIRRASSDPRFLRIATCLSVCRPSRCRLFCIAFIP